MGPWGDALLFSRSALWLTPDELHALWDEYLAFVRRHRRERFAAEEHAAAGGEPPDEARRILVRFLAFPDVD